MALSEEGEFLACTGKNKELKIIRGEMLTN